MGQRRYVRASRGDAGSLPRKEYGRNLAITSETLQDLGATPADVGQGDVSWSVLADPKGNEFDVLTPR